MCGPFTLRTNASNLVEIFTLLRDPELASRFHIALTSRVVVVRRSGNARDTVASRVCLRNYLLCFGAKIGRVSKGKR
jgi:putative SOS response-associated peptidase YedK